MNKHDYESAITLLSDEIDSLYERYELSKSIGPDYYDPDTMQNADCYYGDFDRISGTIFLRTMVKGLRYDNRSLHLDRVHVADKVTIVRDKLNEYNYNNFCYFTAEGVELGYMDAKLCNALAPLYDSGLLVFENSSISYIEQLWQRLRYAKQGVLFVEIKIKLLPFSETADID